MIFTSTPQGLEPGRTGFCTVARHRSLPSRLVRELERTSVYDFNLGEGAKAQINSFRRFDLGSEQFYALTRIRDSGLDYTNRTNYIAHHLIFDGLEVAVSPSPAEIFLQWDGWLDVWEGSARWFEDAEITDVSSCKMQGLSPAQSWQHATNDGGNAAYLVAEKAAHPILLEFEPGQEDDLLLKFAESCALLSMPMEAWQFAFTTYLQETDDAKEFAWVGGCGQPSVERLKQSGAPNHLNFIEFDQLAVKDPMDEKMVFVARNGRKAAIKKKAPPPVAEESAAVGGSVVESVEEPKSTTIRSGRQEGAGGFSRVEKEQYRQAAASHATAQAAVTSQTGTSGKKRKKSPKWPWVAGLAAVMLLAVFAVLKTDPFGWFVEEAIEASNFEEDDLHSQTGGDGNGDEENPDTFPPKGGTNGNSQNTDSEHSSSKNEFRAGIPLLVKVTAKDKRNNWIELQVGSSAPREFPLSEKVFEQFEDQLKEAKKDDELAVTLTKDSETGDFSIVSFGPPEIAKQTPPSPANLDGQISVKDLRSPLIIRSEAKQIDFETNQGLFTYKFDTPEEVERFYELRRLEEAGRMEEVSFKYRIENGVVRDFSFSIPSAAAITQVPTPSPTVPPAFPVSMSYVLWLDQREFDNPNNKSLSLSGDVDFVQRLKKALTRLSQAGDQGNVWETDYMGPQSFIETPSLKGSQRHQVIFDADTSEFLGKDQFHLMTPGENGEKGKLFLKFLFKSSSEVNLIMESQEAKNAAFHGSLMRFPDFETNLAMDLYLLSERVVSKKGKDVSKSFLSLTNDRVSLTKQGAFENGLRVLSMNGSLTHRLSVKPSREVYFGSGLVPTDFTNKKLVDFPNLLVKPVPGNALACELDLFADYVPSLRLAFQQEIAKRKKVQVNPLASQMPKPIIYDALSKFGERVSYSRGNFKPGNGVDTYGLFVIDVVIDFFRKVHGYSPDAAEKLRNDLALDPKAFYKNSLDNREFWRKVCERATKEALSPFGFAYDVKNFSGDIDRVFNTLRFLRESQRTFGVKEEIGAMIFAALRELRNNDTGAVIKLYKQLIAHKATPEARAATPKYSREWKKYLENYDKLHAPDELTSAELIKAIACIENPDLVKAFDQFRFSSQASDSMIGTLRTWNDHLEKKIASKNIRPNPLNNDLANEERARKAFFDSEEWVLSIFRQGQSQSLAELIRFK